MNIAKIDVTGVRAVATEFLPRIPMGITGATVTFDFSDPYWDGLTKTAVFRGVVTRDQIITEPVVKVPADVVAQKNCRLQIGVFGTDVENKIATPTLWASAGMISDAADPSGDPGTDPELPIWAQLAEEVERLKTGGPSTPGQDGGYYTPTVTQPAEDKLLFDFTPSKADMPAVDPVQVTLPVSGGNVDLDTTLTQSGKAADAKATGDAVKNLSDKKVDKAQGTDNALKLLFVGSDGNISMIGGGDNEVVISGVAGDIVNLWEPSNYEPGGFSDGGSSLDSDTTLRTPNYIKIDGGAEYNLDVFNFRNTNGTVYWYNASKEFVSSKYYNSTTAHFVAPEAAVYVKFKVTNWYRYRPDKAPQIMFWKTTSTDMPTEYVEYGKNTVTRLVVPRTAENAAEILANRRAAFDGQMLHIAYSTIELAIINSAEHFLTAAKLGFNALKCDVQPTSDGELVLCHDPGYTFDENGRIMQSYDANNFTAINTLTAAEIAVKEYAGQHYAQGYYTHPCFLEDFIRICKEKGMVAFVTIRDDNIPDIVAPKLIEIVKKYGMEDHVIVNSFNINSLKAVRNLHKTIYLHQVKNYETVLTNAEVDAIDALGNAMISMYVYPSATGTEKLTASESALAYAKMRNVRVYNGQIFTYEQYQESINRGISGVQIAKPILPYKREMYSFDIKVVDGVAEFENRYNAQRFTANVSSSADKITVKNISMLGSTRGFPDGILPIWMHYLPYTMSVKSKNGQKCDVTYSNHAWHITSDDISANDTYTVCVEI